MTAEKISALIPAYNAGKFITETINSILVQTYPVDEIIVVDDGSTDDTAERVQQFGPRVRYFYQENSGVVPARAQALALARGDLIAFLDADDLWLETKLVGQLAVLKAKPQTMIVLGHIQRFWLDASGQKHFLQPELAASFITALIRKKAFAKIPILALSDRTEDLEWFMRAREMSLPIVVQEETVALYRRHGGNTTSLPVFQTGPELIRMLKNSLERRHQMGTGELEELK